VTRWSGWRASMGAMATAGSRCGSRADGWRVNLKRVKRLWRCEGLEVPRRQPRRARLCLNDGSCTRPRPCWPRHVWTYDFVQDQTRDRRAFRMLQ
jgi:hypothetical protein